MDTVGCLYRVCRPQTPVPLRLAHLRVSGETETMGKPAKQLVRRDQRGICVVGHAALALALALALAWTPTET